MKQGVFFYREEQKELEVLAVENHVFCFDIAQILSVALGFFFNKTWDYAVIWIHVFNNIEKHKLLQ